MLETVETVYTQVYKFLSSEGAGKECVKRYGDLLKPTMVKFANLLSSVGGFFTTKGAGAMDKTHILPVQDWVNPFDQCNLLGRTLMSLRGKLHNPRLPQRETTPPAAEPNHAKCHGLNLH
jgi:hypothetical protein